MLPNVIQFLLKIHVPTYHPAEIASWSAAFLLGSVFILEVIYVSVTTYVTHYDRIDVHNPILLALYALIVHSQVSTFTK